VAITKEYRGYKKEYGELLELQKANKATERYISRRITHVQKKLRIMETTKDIEIHGILNQQVTTQGDK